MCLQAASLTAGFLPHLHSSVYMPKNAKLSVVMQVCRCVVLCNLLPELSDGGGEVGGVGSHPEGFVLAVGVLDAVLSVPGLIALGPG